MGRTYTLGGERLGSGNKLEVQVHGWGKSTHNIDQKLKTTVSTGTLVPFIVEPILPGDEIKMNIKADVMTEPTNGALFGSFKFQADVFIGDTRLYNGKMHNNKLRVATNIEEIKLPLVRTKGSNLDLTKDLSNQQVNSSCLMSYLGVRGLGYQTGGATNVQRDFNAIPLLMYWDVYKNYYASKQENIGAVIHTEPIMEYNNISNLTITISPDAPKEIPFQNTDRDIFKASFTGGNFDELVLQFTGTNRPTENAIVLITDGSSPRNPNANRILMSEIFEHGGETSGETVYSLEDLKVNRVSILGWDYATLEERGLTEPKISTFPLVNLDDAREYLLLNTRSTSAFNISSTFFGNSSTPNIAPFNLLLQETGTGANLRTSLVNVQEGLALKTYQSDIFNNWLKTDFIDAINNSSAIAITNNTLFLDQINLSKKVYEHLNRLAVTAGTYRDYIAVSYDVAVRDIEIPIYIGGLSKEIVFQEVISNAETIDKPLGTIGGRGTFTNKNKGGFVEYKAYDYGTLMGIMSITPRIDYTQGNKWFNNLKTLKDLHIPAMDGIGYQDLITDQMAYFDTGVTAAGVLTTRSAGKQPAWINYQTSHDRALGKFATSELNWMILDRDYEINKTTGRILDLTQYVDPKKYNKIFAQASRDAMNFWVLVECNIDIRRVMSAKQIPSF